MLYPFLHFVRNKVDSSSSKVLHLGACLGRRRRAGVYNDSYGGFEVTIGQFTEGETGTRGQALEVYSRCST